MKGLNLYRVHGRLRRPSLFEDHCPTRGRQTLAAGDAVRGQSQPWDPQKKGTRGQLNGNGDCCDLEDADIRAEKMDMKKFVQ